MIRLAMALAVLSGCGATVRVGVGPTIDTAGRVGFLARVSGGYAAGLGHRPRSAIIAVAQGEGGYGQAGKGFGGGGGEVDYLYQPPLQEPGARPVRAPAVRVGMRTSVLATQGPGSPLHATGLTTAVLGPLVSRARSQSFTWDWSSSSKGRGPSFSIDWLTRLFLGAELDAALVAGRDLQSSLAGRFGLLLVLDQTWIGWYAR